MVSRLNKKQPSEEGQENVDLVKIPISAFQGKSSKEKSLQNLGHRKVVTKILRVSLARIDVEKEKRRLKRKSTKHDEEEEEDDDVVVLSPVQKTVPNTFRLILKYFLFAHFIIVYFVKVTKKLYFGHWFRLFDLKI